MTQWSDLQLRQGSRLPDPHGAPEFYNGILAKRALAWVVDIVLIAAITFVAGILTLTIGFFLWPLFFLVIGATYRLVTLAGGSATWGMRLMGIELRGHDGERLDGLQSILHVIGYYVSFAFVLPALTSLGAMLLTDRRQGLTDMILGTAAINRPS